MKFKSQTVKDYYVAVVPKVCVPEMDSSHHLFTVTVLMPVHVETETVPLIAYTHQTVLF